MGVLKDLKVLYHIALSPIKGDDHKQRLESFYSGQAADYDDFRKRLLKGREDMYQALDLPEGGTWVDLGGGTGANLEAIAERIPKLEKVTVVDLSPSLLAVARERAKARGWTNVECIEGDATRWQPEAPVDAVTFSYSLTMIPDWFAAMDHAADILAPGGQVGVVDFYISRKYPEPQSARHGWVTRSFWPAWFGADNVNLSPDHLPYLQRRFSQELVHERRAKVPYIPFLRVPYYIFLGRKAPLSPAPAAASHASAEA